VKRERNGGLHLTTIAKRGKLFPDEKDLDVNYPHLKPKGF
jgi:hypothetical protein